MDVMRPIHEWPEGGYGFETSVAALAVQTDDNKIYKTASNHFSDWLFPYDYTPPTRTARLNNISLKVIQLWAHPNPNDPNRPRARIFHYLNKGETYPVDITFENQFYCVLQSGVILDTPLFFEWLPYRFEYVQESFGIYANKYSKAVRVNGPGEEIRYGIAIPNLPAGYANTSKYLISLNLVTYKPEADIWNLRILIGYRILVWSALQKRYVVFLGPYQLNETHYPKNLAYQKVGLHANIVWVQTDRDYPGTCATPQNIVFEPLYKINQLTQNLATELPLCTFSVIRIA